VNAPRPLGSLLVELNGHVLALAPGSVRAVVASSKVAALPRANQGLLGVVHLEGRFVTLVNLALALGLPPEPAAVAHLAAGERCIWLAEPHQWAFRADRVLGFEEIESAAGATSGWGRAAKWGERAVWEVDVAVAARCVESLLEMG
jgi:chemotaxis signal transduction protein